MSDNGYAGLLAVANGWKTRAEAAEAERDALAAHARRAVTEWEADDQFEDDWIERMDHLLKCEAPAVSLARMRDERAQAIQQAVKQARMEWAREDRAALDRLKAEWQAEGAQLTADSIRYVYEGEIHQDRIADHADEVAAELRRQAQEPTE